MNVHTLAAAAIICMIAIIVLMDWVPTPFNRNINGISVSARLPSTIIHSSIGAIFVVVNILTLKWAIFGGAVWFSIISIVAVINWWLPYLAGVHWGEINPEVYERHYANNITVLPPIKGHPIVPDVQHTLIHLAVFAVTILSWYSFAKA